ncbi:pantoate--beta-alanine ligase [Desulfitibacter alkalitolerans]|uniref:pantoate--beta-alanine ligase n=1 Tax=Desulfitibacter alkalitolerans TaxID=264641 RepID=UPI000485CAEE|nr:pantoate--beta-alanine ligase [Desulfitibacter alkalitolerans]
MEILKTIRDTKSCISELKKQGQTIGLVPTMGYFHDGHLELMRRSLEKGHATIVSLFVNPAQFGPAEDFDSYPKNLQRDLDLAKEIGVKAVFMPTINDMYPKGYKTYVEVEGLSNVLCGEHRPGHFRGVATVVLKLFNIVKPDEAFFGQKDGQQVIIIKKMVQDLDLDIPIEVIPTVREEDGVAMSSRNAYLSPVERQAAPILYQTLKLLEEMILEGERNVSLLLEAGKNNILKEPLADLQYIDIRSTDDLSPLEELRGEFMIATAVKVGPARLIDNIVLRV